MNYKILYPYGYKDTFCVIIGSVKKMIKKSKISMFYSLNQWKSQWFFNISKDILSGIVVALALIPEAIAFSTIAGVDPKVGLYASFCIATVTAFIGGRPGMISAATGAMAILMVTLVKNHGIEYLFAATILTGILQIIAGYLRLATLLKFVSKSVVNGFVNALAILIFMSQISELKMGGINTYVMVGFGLAVIYLFPFITKKIPSPLVAIISLTAISLFFNLDVRNVGDLGNLPNDLPSFLIPNIELSFKTIEIIFPYSFALAAVGILESLMTSVIVDEMTDTKSKKNQECIAQGFANIVSGMFGGMAGCAMIGQSVINTRSGGRGRLSTLFAGCFLLFLILIMDTWVKQIPMAALVAVMIMVSIGTFRWESFKEIYTLPKTSTITMISTVIVVIATDDLAKGVLTGVIVNALCFSRHVSHVFTVESSIFDNIKTYTVKGNLFFASAESFSDSFDYKDEIKNIKIDLSNSNLWDLYAVEALDDVVMKFKNNNKNIHITGLNKASESVIQRIKKKNTLNHI